MSTTDCNEGGAINIPSGGHEEAAAGLDQRQAYAELIEQAALGPVHKRLADVVWRDHVNVPPKRVSAHGCWARIAQRSHTDRLRFESRDDKATRAMHLQTQWR